MALGQIIRRHGALIIGLALPVLLMVVFMASTFLATMVNDPPRYDMVFSVNDFSTSTQSPVNPILEVKSGVLRVEYRKNKDPKYTAWKKLYLFDAKTQKVKPLAFPLPRQVDEIPNGQIEIVASTKDLKFDTNLESPDGYQLSRLDDNEGGGLLGALLWSNRGRNQACIKKGSTCIKLVSKDSFDYFYPGYIQFIGWVKP